MTSGLISVNLSEIKYQSKYQMAGSLVRLLSRGALGLALRMSMISVAL